MEVAVWEPNAREGFKHFRRKNHRKCKIFTKISNIDQMLSFFFIFFRHNFPEIKTLFSEKLTQTIDKLSNMHLYRGLGGPENQTFSAPTTWC